MPVAGRRPSQVNIRKSQTLLLPLAIAVALAACSKKEDAAPAAAAAPAAPAATEFTLDESKLPAYNAFQPSDLDTTKDACTAFGDYVNSKWLAANEIPGDRTSWGAFTILDERSVAVQHQLAEQVAQVKNPNHIEKIVGDLWATGMDEAKINAQGIEPLKADLAAIDGLQDKAAIANYLRTSAAKGDNVLFGFGAEADFKNSAMNMAYASQGGLGLPDTTYYTDAKNADKLNTTVLPDSTVRPNISLRLTSIKRVKLVPRKRPRFSRIRSYTITVSFTE